MTTNAARQRQYRLRLREREQRRLKTLLALDWILRCSEDPHWHARKRAIALLARWRRHEEGGQEDE